MALQIAIGAALVLISIICAGAAFWTLEAVLTRRRDWLMRAPHWPKLILLVCLTACLALAVVSVSVWLWAFAYLALGLFSTVEESVYFSLVAFTTLGFGDILLAPEWRLLGGIEATNGLLSIGLLTSLMLEAGRFVRRIQAQSLRDGP